MYLELVSPSGGPQTYLRLMIGLFKSEKLEIDLLYGRTTVQPSEMDSSVLLRHARHPYALGFEFTPDYSVSFVQAGSLDRYLVLLVKRGKDTGPSYHLTSPPQLSEDGEEVCKCNPLYTAGYS